MHNLFKILLFNFLLFSVAQAETGAKLDQLRDLSLLMTIPESICKAAVDLGPYLRSEGRLIYENALGELKDDFKNSKSQAVFLKDAKSCRKNCTCEIYAEFEELAPKESRALLKSARLQAEKMQTKDYESCQARLKLGCDSTAIQSAIENIRKAKENAEKNP